MTEAKVRVESVRVVGRYRTDLGDVESLAASIKRSGLIHAIAVTPDMRLLAGGRRLAAARMLGWESIDARIVDTIDDAAEWLRLERDENTQRKPMRPSELVALGKALESLERPKAEQRKRAGQFGSGQLNGTGTELTAGETRDVVASALGMSASTYARAKMVVAAATDPGATVEQLEIAQEAMTDMDSGAASISGAYERVIGGVRTRRGAPTRSSLISLASQQRAISSAATALSGICLGLDQITELHPEITYEEAARWADSLSKSRRTLAALIRHLKERTNAHPS